MDTSAELLKQLMRPDTFVLLIPIAGILVGGIIAVTKLVIRHRERMALIEQGLYPDHLPEESRSPDDRAR
jgi:hypothetical protein